MIDIDDIISEIEANVYILDYDVPLVGGIEQAAEKLYDTIETELINPILDIATRLSRLNFTEVTEDIIRDIEKITGNIVPR